MRHIKTKHLTSSQGDAFADIEKDYQKHLTNKRSKAYQKDKKRRMRKGSSRSTIKLNKIVKRGNERRMKKISWKSTEKKSKRVSQKGKQQM